MIPNYEQNIAPLTITSTMVRPAADSDYDVSPPILTSNDGKVASKLVFDYFQKMVSIAINYMVFKKDSYQITFAKIISLQMNKIFSGAITPLTRLWMKSHSDLKKIVDKITSVFDQHDPAISNVSNSKDDPLAATRIRSLKSSIQRLNLSSSNISTKLKTILDFQDKFMFQQQSLSVKLNVLNSSIQSICKFSISNKGSDKFMEEVISARILLKEFSSMSFQHLEE